MAIAGFQHINIRSTDAERARDFYVGILGLRVGDRPPFSFHGYWLYLGDQAMVHLVQRGPEESASAESSNLDHVAFHGVDLDGTREALRAADIPFRESVVPRNGTVQIFVHDPDGIKLELSF